MMPVILFGAGLLLGVLILIVDGFAGGKIKQGVLASPFMLLLAAAVAKYLGIS